MNIIQRNFFRLIRSGAFNTTEHIEPMSVYKWERLMQLTIMHQVVPYVYEGLQRCKNQFFLKQTDYQWREWLKLKQDAERMINDDEGDEFLRADHLTNPLLNRQLQNILDDEHSDTISRKLLLLILREIPVSGETAGLLLVNNHLRVSSQRFQHKRRTPACQDEQNFLLP